MVLPNKARVYRRRPPTELERKSSNIDMLRQGGSRAKGSRVGNAREFSTVLEAAFQQGGVHLVVAPIDYSENMRVLVNELHSVVQPV